MRTISVKTILIPFENKVFGFKSFFQFVSSRKAGVRPLIQLWIKLSIKIKRMRLCQKS